MINESFRDHNKALESALNEIHKVEAWVNGLIKCFESGGKLLVSGNGGSAADAAHFVAELVIRFKEERISLPAICLNANMSNVTAAGNDYGYENVFSRQIEGLLSGKDYLLLLSTSGSSSNIVNAYEAGRKKVNADQVLVLTSTRNSFKYEQVVEIDSQITARIQEAHYFILHYMCELIDRHYA